MWHLVLGLACLSIAACAPAENKSPPPTAARSPESAASAADPVIVTSHSQLEGLLGQRIVAEGVVVRSKIPELGCDDFGLDLTGPTDWHSLAGRKAKVSGVLRKYVVPEQEEGEEEVASRGPGTYYELTDIEYELLD